MSESLGWSDNIIFAMAPLGIITAIVGAIRVGGPTWLKAIIGRARENRATAEAELMSSISPEVCEVWDGGQVVRVVGSLPIQELLYVGAHEENEVRTCTLDQALTKEYLKADGELVHFLYREGGY